MPFREMRAIAFGTILGIAVLMQSGLPPIAFAEDAERAGDLFPYQALVRSDDTDVRSGPGDVHYATEKLKQGEVVFVYRHDPGDWCAIRPPNGSFSLVAETAVERLENGTGVVRENGVQAWVGTRLGPVDRPLWQVKLRMGERLQILGEVSWPNPDGNSIIWLQIAPPSGEFRWIRLSQLQVPDRKSEVLEASTANVPTSNRPRPGNARDTAQSFENRQAIYQEFESPDLEPPLLQGPTELTTNKGWKRATRPLRVADNANRVPSDYSTFQVPAISDTSKSHWDNVSRQELDSESSLSPFQSNPSYRGSISPNREITPNQIESHDVVPQLPALDPAILSHSNATLNELELALTSEMIKTPDEWLLQPIQTRALSILNSASSTTQEREHAQRILEKINRCQQLQVNLNKINARTRQAAQAGTNTNDEIGTGVDDTVKLGTTYDAYGWLNELVQENGSSPSTFVLEDENGRITHHISAAPGLNLNRYLKSKIGVIGQRGYHRHLKLNHVTAERVVLLEKKLR
jgi:hypothetical protein